MTKKELEIINKEYKDAYKELKKYQEYYDTSNTGETNPYESFEYGYLRAIECLSSSLDLKCDTQKHIISIK
jgi:hypothetical protein